MKNTSGFLDALPACMSRSGPGGMLAGAGAGAGAAGTGWTGLGAGDPAPYLEQEPPGTVLVKYTY